MKIVGVKHPGCDKLYWFGLDSHWLSVAKGSRVMCDTSMGNQLGIVETNLIEGDVEALKGQLTGGKEYKRILEIEMDVPINNIIIPKYMTDAYPNKNLLIKRINEFYDLGGFDTKVQLTKDFRLRDGYTAWMVAKMMGLPTLKAFVAI